MRISSNKLSIYWLSLVFIVSFLPFLRLSMWSGGYDTIAAGDPVSIVKVAIRLIMMLVVFIYCVKYHRELNQLIKGPNLSLFIFFLLAFFSLSYSSDPIYSAFRLAEHVGLFLMAVFIVFGWSRELDNYTAIISKIIDLVIYSLFPLILIIWAFLAFGSPYVWRHMIGDSVGLGGQVLHVHTLAIICSILFGLFLNRFFVNFGFLKLFYGLASVLVLITLFFTLSRTGYFMAVISALAILIHHKKLILAFFMAFLVLFWAGLNIELDFGLVVDLVKRGQTLEDLISLTTRTIFWKELIVDTTLESPFLGYGYQMMGPDGTTKVFESLGGTVRSSAHNTFIQTYAGLGVFGLIILAWNITNVLLRYLHLRSPKKKGVENLSMIFLIVIMCLIASLTQYGIVGMTTPVAPLYYLCVALLSTRTIMRCQKFTS